MGCDPWKRQKLYAMGQLSKSEQSLTEEEGQNWENSKACTF